MPSYPNMGRVSTARPATSGTIYDEWTFKNADKFREFLRGMNYVIAHPEEFTGVDTKKAGGFLALLKTGKQRFDGHRLVILTPAQNTKPTPELLRDNHLCSVRRVCLMDVEGGRN